MNPVSVSDKSRYDKYIPIFSPGKTDYRIRLWLDTLYKTVNAHDDIKSPPGPAPEKIKWMKIPVPGAPLVPLGGAIPIELTPKFFDERFNGIQEDQPHPEWFIFFLQLGLSLADKTFTNIDTNFMNAINNLDPNNDLDLFCICILDKISSFKINNTPLTIPPTPMLRPYVNRELLKNNNITIEFSKLFQIVDKLIWKQTNVDILSDNHVYEYIYQHIYYKHGGALSSTRLVIRAIAPQPGIDPPLSPDQPNPSVVVLLNLSDDIKTHTYHKYTPDLFEQLKIESKRILNAELRDPIQPLVLGGPIITPFGPRPLTMRAMLLPKDNRAHVPPTNFVKIVTDYFNNLSLSFFKYRIDKFFLSTILKDYTSNSMTKLEDIDTYFFNDKEFPELNVNDKSTTDYYFRKNGILFKNIDGKEICVEGGSELYNKLTLANKCYGTGFKDDNNKKCQDFFVECLQGNNIAQCKEFLSNPNYWSDIESEVNDMLPIMVHELLIKFQFKAIEANLNNQRISKIFSVEQWLLNLRDISNNDPSTLSSDDCDKINKNDKLLAYLRHLVRKLNNNPIILNPNYVAPKIELSQQMSILGNRPLNPKFFNRNVGFSAKIASAIKGILATSNRNMFSIKNRPYGLLRGRFQLGGNTEDDLSIRLKEINLQTHSIFRSHFIGLVDRLQKMGKLISKNDEIKVKKAIDRLEKLERKLNEVLLYIEKYANLMELYKHTDDNNLLSLNYLKKFVDTRNAFMTKTSSKQDYIGQFLIGLADQIGSVKDISASQI